MNKVGKKRVTATLVIALINVLVFVVNVAVGGGNRFWIFLTGGGYLKEYGEVALSLITEQGQWWRLLTCGYLHMGVVHLVGNMAALEIVGTKVERRISPVKLLLIFNLGTILTAFLWCLFFRSESIIGASLGIFVLLGMLCVLLLGDREKKSISFSRYEKGYLIFYVIAGCFLGIGTIVVHLIGGVIGILLGFVLGRWLWTKEL